MSYLSLDLNAPNRHKQQGAAFIVMLVIVVLGVATVLVASLSTAGLQIAREVKTSEALAQAKSALIGYAATDNNRPGELPCPDTDNDGSAETLSGSNCSGGNLGRLPWKTLGLPDLRDAAGERLWYSVSDPIHAGASGPLNSDTVGTINISGNVSATQLVAIVFSPGQPLAILNQVRTAANENTYTHYLESVLTPFTSFQLLASNDHPGGNFDYNDQLLAITHDDLFRVTELAVGKRVRNELFNTTRTYWRPFPNAAQFNDLSNNNTFVRTTGSNYGLLPVYAVWSGAPPPSISLSGGSATTSYSITNGSTSSMSSARLRIYFSSVSSSPDFSISATLTPSLGLWRPYDLTNQSELRIRVKGTCAAPDQFSGSTSDCSVSGANAAAGVNAAIGYTTNADGSVTVTLTGTLINAVTRIDWRDVYYDTTYDWFMDNEWYKVMYYAVSPGYVGGGSACSPLPTPPSCITVTGSGAGNDKHALVVMTGRALAGQVNRASPANLISDYLEGANAAPISSIYETRTLADDFNDKVIPIAP